MQRYLFWLLFTQATFSASHHPEKFLHDLKNDPHKNEKIYEVYCANCHAKKPLIPVGAPRLGDIKDWSLRLKKGKTILLKHTLEGYGLMPARGGCFECRDEDLTGVYDWMISELKSEKSK